ncbi:MAG: hypothetical protein E3J94_07230 [Desulfobacteraceae bacterium]|nr:MAG: hypothetical protein E3J94_07230 [Desulfobacteraceae bacterium]
MNITRRNFLKSVGILAAGSLFIPYFRILLPGDKIMGAETKLFKIRKLCGYDLEANEIVVRYDVAYWNKKRVATQYHVSAILSTENIKRDEFIQRYHRPMTAVLRKQIRYDRVLLGELMPLGYPHGYYEPEWFTELIRG